MARRFLQRVGTAEQISWLEGIAKAVIVINLLDGVFTLLWIRMGVATEANVLMRSLAMGYPVLFMVIKLALVSLGTALLWRYRTRPAAAIGLIVIFLVYYTVLLIHVRYMGYLLSWLLGRV
ncbi:MAG: DUF5658 family protein [Desulfovibrionales bacterium]